MARRLLLFAPLLLLAACTPLTAFNAVVPKDGGVRMAVRDAAFGPGPRQRLDVYAPRNAGGERPVILFLYGGSWNSGAKAGYGFVGRALAARGFVTVIPDYRLVPEVRFPDFIEDNAAAFRWIRGNIARHAGDPDRIVVVGHSAGAYNAAMLALDPRWLGADRAALRGWAGLAGPYDFLPFDLAVTKAAFGAWPEPAATQPISHATAGDPPALLMTGGADTLVGAHNAVNLAAALREAGVPVETRVYPRIGHIGMVTSFATLFRRKAPVLGDLAAFADRVSAGSP